MQLGEGAGGVSPEPGKPREAVPRERILIAVTRCRRKVGRGTPRSRVSLQVRHPTQLLLVQPGFRLTLRDRKDPIVIQMRLPPLALKGCSSPGASGECIPLPASPSHCLSGWADSDGLADGQGATFVQGSGLCPLSKAGRTNNV